MQAPWINTLGDWNPQFLRECRGRLKPRSIAATFTLSFIPQLLAFLSYWQIPRYLAKHDMNWLGLWNTMTWLMAYGLIIVGSYFLVNDITQEDRLGTLNFIRLSPRPGREILLGKLMGVPILAYLGVALAIPLHVVAGVLGLVPWVVLVSVYVILLAGALFFFSAALLFGLINSSQRLIAGQQSAAALGFTIALVMLGLPTYLTWCFQTVWKATDENPYTSYTWRKPIEWAFFPIESNVGLAHLFTLLVLAISTAFVWRMLLRRFLTPKATGMSKRMSYALVAYVEILVVGFTLSSSIDLDQPSGFGVVLLYGVNLFLFFILMFSLCPVRQEILDWLRFRYSHQVGTSNQFSWLGALRDLVWVDSSPGVLAIALNLCIASALIIPWALLIGPGKIYPGICILLVVVMCTAILIEATVVQLIFVSRIRNPGTWAAGILGIWLIVPITILNILQITPSNTPLAMIAYTLLGYPFTNLRTPLYGEILIGFVIQMLVLILLNSQLKHKLQQLTPNLNSTQKP